MPPLVRRYVKTSFVFLISGLVLGGYIVVAQSVVGIYPPRLFITAHVHLLLVGFMLMIVMGVATWMFPRPARDDQRYRLEMAEAVYWLMTVATVVRALAELTALFTPAPAVRVVSAAGGLGQLTGALLFVINMWSRVRMPAVPGPSRPDRQRNETHGDAPECQPRESRDGARAALARIADVRGARGTFRAEP